MNASESIVTPDAEVEAPAAPITLEDLLQAVDDGSRFAEGVDSSALVEEINAKAKSLKSSVVTVTTRRKNMAEALANARRAVLRPDGRPDWEGDTKTWAALASVAYDSAFADLPKADIVREQNAVRQHIARTYLETAIRSYVAESETTDGDKVYPDEESMSSEPFLFAVRRQYKDAGLAIPPRYQTPEDKAAGAGSGAGPGNGAAHAAEVALKGIEGLNSVVPAMHAKAALKTVSDLVKRVSDPKAGAIEGREIVRDDLVRINDLASFALRALDGVSTEKDADEIAGAYWTASDGQ